MSTDRQDVHLELRGLPARMIEIGGFLALAALMIGLFAWLKADISRLDGRLNARIDDLGQETREAVDRLRGEIVGLRERLDGRLRAVEHGQAKLKGLLEGLREAISGRSAA